MIATDTVAYVHGSAWSVAIGTTAALFLMLVIQLHNLDPI